MTDKCTSPEGHRMKVQPRPWTLEREGDYATIHDANGQIVGPLVDLGLGWTDTSTSPPTLSENDDWIPTYDLHAAAADVWQEKGAAVAEDLAFIVEVVNEHASLTKKVERLDELPSLVPTTWLDPIFVGDNAVDTSKCDGQQVEALLLAIKKRLSDALLESER